MVSLYHVNKARMAWIVASDNLMKIAFGVFSKGSLQRSLPADALCVVTNPQDCGMQQRLHWFMFVMLLLFSGYICGKYR